MPIPPGRGRTCVPGHTSNGMLDGTFGTPFDGMLDGVLDGMFDGVLDGIFDWSARWPHELCVSVRACMRVLVCVDTSR